MNIRELYHCQKKILLLYADIDTKISFFQKEYGLKCQKPCGLCCYKDDVYATMIEFIPLALDIYNRNEGDPAVRMLSQCGAAPCSFYNYDPMLPGEGECSVYPQRGLICRLFGFSTVRDKYSQLQFSTCRAIKFAAPEQIVKLNGQINHIDGPSLPNLSHSYGELFNLCYGLDTAFYPVNTAIKKALEWVLFLFYYRKPRRA